MQVDEEVQNLAGGQRPISSNADSERGPRGANGSPCARVRLGVAVVFIECSGNNFVPRCWVLTSGILGTNQCLVYPSMGPWGVWVGRAGRIIEIADTVSEATGQENGSYYQSYLQTK